MLFCCKHYSYFATVLLPLLYYTTTVHGSAYIPAIFDLQGLMRGWKLLSGVMPGRSLSPCTRSEHHPHSNKARVMPGRSFSPCTRVRYYSYFGCGLAAATDTMSTLACTRPREMPGRSSSPCTWLVVHATLLSYNCLASFCCVRGANPKTRVMPGWIIPSALVGYNYMVLPTI